MGVTCFSELLSASLRPKQFTSKEEDWEKYAAHNPLTSVFNGSSSCHIRVIVYTNDYCGTPINHYELLSLHFRTFIVDLLPVHTQL